MSDTDAAAEWESWWTEGGLSPDLKRRIRQEVRRRESEARRQGFVDAKAALEGSPQAVEETPTSAPAAATYRFDTPTGAPWAALFHSGSYTVPPLEEPEPEPGSIEWAVRNMNIRGEPVRRKRRADPEPPLHIDRPKEPASTIRLAEGETGGD